MTLADAQGRVAGKAYPQPLPKGGEDATPEARPAEKERELKGRNKKEMRYGREYC